MNTKRSTKFSIWPIARKLHPWEKPGHRKAKSPERPYSTIVGVIAGSNLHTIIALYLIAVLLALNIILRYPNLGAIIAQYNQF